MSATFTERERERLRGGNCVCILPNTKHNTPTHKQPTLDAIWCGQITGVFTNYILRFCFFLRFLRFVVSISFSRGYIASRIRFDHKQQSMLDNEINADAGNHNGMFCVCLSAVHKCVTNNTKVLFVFRLFCSVAFPLISN